MDAPVTIRRACGVLLAGAIAAAIASCRAFAANEAAKDASLAPWRDARIDGRPALEWLAARTATVIDGTDELAPVPDSNGTLARPRLHGRDASQATAGAAVAIDERGYWLTAAHCVETGPSLLLVRRDGGVDARPVRVVWSERDDEHGLDLALLHAPGPVEAVARFGATLPASGAVLCAGSGLGSGAFAAGRITGVSGSVDGRGPTWIEHDAPLAPGDSGGPAILSDGTLVGVDVETAARPFGGGEPSSTALRPDLEVLRRVIEEDVARVARRVAAGSEAATTRDVEARSR